MELDRASRALPENRPGSKGKRGRLDKIVVYLTKRLHMMDYDYLLEEDLEIASGSVEGAVKHLIAKRFDCGSMRWIKERAEALLQLRCVEFNGDWQPFIEFVRERMFSEADTRSQAPTLLTSEPPPLEEQHAA